MVDPLDGWPILRPQSSTPRTLPSGIMSPLKATVVATCSPPDTKNLLFCVKTAEATNVFFVRQRNQLWRFPLFEVEFLFLIASGWWEEVKEVDDDDAGQPLRRRDTARSWWYLCILVFGYLCMRRKKKVVVRSRSLRTSESAPPSPLHASELLLRTATYFFCLLLATYFFLALITTYCMGCKGLFAQWNKFLLLRAFQRSPAKGFYTYESYFMW